MLKMQSFKILVLVFISVLCIAQCSAIPNSAVTNTTSNSVTIQVLNAQQNTWILWSENNHILNYMTQNYTPDVNGAANITIRGANLFANQQYFYTANDITGASGIHTFTTGPITLIPQTTYGQAIGNILATGQFDPITIMTDAISPYIWVMPIVVFYTILWFFIFLGIWIRQRDVLVISIVGMLVALFITSPSSGISTGVSPEFAMAGQALLYISIASAIVAVFKR